MLVHIPVEELDINPSWAINKIIGVSIDYADSTVHAIFYGEAESAIIFRLKSYGMTLDNRCCGYHVSHGPAGIFIKLTK
jgi:hypothetical protein